MVSITKKDNVWKHIWRILVRSSNRSVILLWNCRLHILMESLTITIDGVGSQACYFVGDYAGGPLVRVTGVRGSI